MSQYSSNYQRLLETTELEGQFELLSADDAEDCVEWLSDNFSLPYGQIDWTDCPEGTSEKLPQLDYEQLAQRLTQLWLKPDAEVLLVWSDADEVVSLRWKDALEHLETLWLPGKEDVWLIPSDESGCIELHHENRLGYIQFED